MRCSRPASGNFARRWATTPRRLEYIETAHRRGYRFIGHTSADTANSPPASVLSGIAMPATRSALAAASPGKPQHLLGREVEFGKLQEWLERALAGERQIVFVTGEPGIGKTTLVNELLRQASGATDVWIARGQCLEQYRCRRSVPARARRLVPAGSCAGRRTDHQRPAPARPGMAARVAVTPAARGTRDAAAAGVRRDARADVARDGGGHRSDHRRAAAHPRARGSALERLLDRRSCGVPRATPRSRPADGDRHLSTGRDDSRRPSAESRQAGAAGARVVS